MTLKHQCPKCPKTFCSPSKLQRHFLIHTGQKPYSCAICWKTFRQKVHLKSHLNTANKCSLSSSNARKRQSLCNNSQTSVLQPHSSIQQPTSHHSPGNSSGELELQCEISVNAVQDPKTQLKSDADVNPDQQLNINTRCWSSCHTADEQEEQYITDKDLKPFQCKFCNRSFRLELNLARHHKMHRNPKQLGSPNSVQNSIHGEMSDSEAIKDLCEPSQADLNELNIVVKPENWSENYSNYVPQELITSVGQWRENCSTTRQQQRINTLHQCHTCLKCFPSVSKLQRHMMTHTGQRPFGCEMCGKRFRQKTHLRVHCRTHLWSRYHKQRSLYINRPPSRIGGYRRTSADIPIQEMVVHKKELETQNCTDGITVKHLDQTSSIDIVRNNYKRESQNKLLPHTSKNSEVLLMKKVSKATVKRTHTVKSTQNPGNTQHRCFQCLKCFQSASKLQRHEMVHTGLKPFKCPTCGKAFRQASHLKAHERTHCKKKPSKPVNHQGSIEKLKMNSQQRLYPRITVCIPPQKKFVNIGSTHSVYDGAVSNGESVLLCTRSEISVTKGESLKSNTTLNTCKKRKLYMCRICCKKFPTPYKLSRHSVTHSGIRPYKCTLCSKTFTQRGHLKVHEHRCRQGKMISDCTQREMINATHTQDKCLENLNDCTDFNVGAKREQQRSHYTSVGHYSFSDVDLSYCSRAIDSTWLIVPELCLQEENNESEKKQTENCNKATDHYNFSFPSELAFEMNKLVQNQKAASPFTHMYDHNAHNVETPCKHREVMAFSDSNKLLSDVVENQIQTDLSDDYRCEPLIVLECDKRTESFRSKNDLKQHICSVDVQPKITASAEKNCCDICFKKFVSPSKLKRHYLIHTGQRPFKCDVCGKTFTQASHVRTHRLTH